MANLVCIRHGQSLWNKENKFTGWVDIELSEQGKEEAKKAADLLKEIKFDIVYTSVLKRAINTANIILENNNSDPEIIRDKALNERHYGDLQGLNKAEVGEKVGAEQLHVWRRSYDVAPPEGESLKDTLERVIPYFESEILPIIKAGKSVLISAHGNSLRALAMYLENISKEDISDINIPTGQPYIYKFDDSFKVISKKYIDTNE
jgi:2,3-bisphosphoglycerate-dependent phosphoglycerate mutase